MKSSIQNQCLAFIIFTALLFISGCFSYNMELRSFSSIRFKGLYNNFTFHTKPVPPFESGMLFSPTLLDISPDIEPMEKLKLPPNLEKWLKGSLSKEQRSKVLKKLVSIKAVEGTKKPIILSENMDLEYVVPGLQVLLSLFKVEDFRTGTDVTVLADRFETRTLVWSEVLEAIKKGLIKKEIADTIMEKDYVIAVEELIVHGYKVAIRVNRNTNPELMFAMHDAFERRMAPQNIYFKLSAINPFLYTINEPVAIGTLWKRKPGKDAQEKIHPPPLFEDVQTWEPVQIPLGTLSFLEEKGPKKYDR